MLDDSEIQRALVVTAHPDDVDYGAGGTVAGWVDAGIEVTYAIVTDGGTGGFDPAVPRADMPGIRRAEQVAAATCLGVSDVRFLGYTDGELTVTMELRRDISRVIRQVRPQRILLQSPDRNWARIGSSHPDHMAAGQAAMFAVYPDARNPFAHQALLADEGLEAWIVPEIWVMAHPDADHAVDVTDTFGRKIEALRAHASQTSHVEDLRAQVAGWLASNAARLGLDPERLYEVFKVVTV